MPKTIFLKGGIGNQLFQLSHIYNNYYLKNREVSINIGNFNFYKFPHSFTTKKIVERLNLKTDKKKQSLNFFISGFLSKFNENLDLFGLNGYFQQSFVFNEEFKIICQEELNKTPISINKDILIHIRGKDYVYSNKDYIVEMQKFFDRLDEQFKDYNNACYCTDDSEFAKKFLSSRNIEASHIDGNFTQIQEFKNVISFNSTYAWWSTYLGGNQLFSSKNSLGFRCWPNHSKEISC